MPELNSNNLRRYAVAPEGYAGRIKLDLVFSGDSLTVRTKWPEIVQTGDKPPKTIWRDNPPFTVSLAEMKRRQAWKAWSTWGVLFDRGRFRPVGLANLTAESYLHKSEPQANLLSPLQSFIFLKVPFEDVETFGEIGVQVLLPTTDSELTANEPFTEVTPGDEPGEYFPGLGLMPRLELTGPGQVPAGGAAEVDITPFWLGQPTTRLLRVELLNINGYLPVTQLNLAGPGRFKVLALGLEPGQKVKVKAGFRYFTNAAEITLEVI
ncbi:hypothetical protein FACS189460_3080 [Deltaproteobacteria bacterium]|nr:hypothetical protein FACS189460_3080 [Deltaproteobacteria bacterium]